LGLNLARFRVFFLEPVNSALGVNQFLAAREERMAAGANFNAQIAFVG
jgi:hypothetical protein